MSRPSQVIVVAEDNHQQMLLYRYLIKRGLQRHQITIKVSPSGKGSAESWVRRRYVVEVRAYRNRQARASSALIVVVDADRNTLHQRLAQLNHELSGENGSPVSEEEQVARLVPKRNIETWILSLNRHAVDEETDYKRTRDDWEDLIPPAANTLAQWTRQQPEPTNNVIPSLQNGIGEPRRLRLRE